MEILKQFYIQGKSQLVFSILKKISTQVSKIKTNFADLELEEILPEFENFVANQVQ